eukprot:gene6931-7149_t
MYAGGEEGAKEGVDDGSGPLKPRGRPRKQSVPIQAAASSEEPTANRMFQFNKVSGSQRRGDQDTRQSGEQDSASTKRFRAQSGDELDTELTEQEQLPPKRKRNQLFSIQDIIAAERGEQAAAGRGVYGAFGGPGADPAADVYTPGSEFNPDVLPRG